MATLGKRIIGYQQPVPWSNRLKFIGLIIWMGVFCYALFLAISQVGDVVKGGEKASSVRILKKAQMP